MRAGIYGEMTGRWLIRTRSMMRQQLLRLFGDKHGLFGVGVAWFPQLGSTQVAADVARPLVECHRRRGSGIAGAEPRADDARPHMGRADEEQGHDRAGRHCGRHYMVEEALDGFMTTTRGEGRNAYVPIQEVFKQSAF